MRLSEIIKYYSNRQIANALVEFGRNREVVPKFGESFGKRPDILSLPGDVAALARKGATSFHASEERWSDPLQLKQESTKEELDKLRIGWDLVLDVDCKILEWSTLCAQLLLKALKLHGVRSASLKFSGGTGWHIGVHGRALAGRLIFPDDAQAIARYLKEFIRPHLEDGILELEHRDLARIAKKVGKKPKELLEGHEFDPFKVLEIDTVAIAPRHLIRAPYSLNEKRWLVSLPIKPKEIEQFELNWAKPANVEVRENFLTGRFEEGEAKQLVMQARDWIARQQKEKHEAKPDREFIIKGKVPESAYPPCIKRILAGLPDGRKRSLFILVNFFKGLGWTWTEIEAKIWAWNAHNRPPLKSGYVRSQLRWHARQKLRIPPPNCADYYKDFGVCAPNKLCHRIKNPLSYVRFKSRN